MNFLEKKYRIMYLRELILKSRCESLDEIAKKFECSRRTVERMIEILNEDGCNIRFCRKEKKYKNFEDDNF